MDKPNQKKKKSGSFSWSVSQEEMQEQVANYHKLSITKSFRGQAVLATAIILTLTIVLQVFLGAGLVEIFSGLLIYGIILAFVYKGFRWAIITLIILWTIEKIYTLSSGSVMSILWWLAIMPFYVKALKVELYRKKMATNKA